MKEMQETRVLSLGWGDPLEEEMATQSSSLGWKIPWAEELGGLKSLGWQEWGVTEQHAQRHCMPYRFYND